MRIDTLTLRGFRCFGEDGQTIELEDLTCFLGPNASGKTAAMVALARLFGESRAQRLLVPTDFHVPEGERLDDKAERSILIECRLAFPELEGGDEARDAVPEAFNQMIVEEPGATPYCRIRLEATWTNDGTPEGEIEQKVSWILTNSADPNEIDDGNRRNVQAADRSMVRVIYVPATRDPDSQIRSSTSTGYGRLMKALEWSGKDQDLREKLQALQGGLAALQGVQTVNAAVQSAWQKLYDGEVAQSVAFEALEEDPARLVGQLVPIFRPAEDGRGVAAGGLSEGLRSLFSLSLSFGLFQVEKQLRDLITDAGFKAEIVDHFPVLTVFAVEEPENHLSPHYLGKVIGELLALATENNAQILISSHSPCIAGRIEPDCVRYFLGHEKTAYSQVRRIPLPKDESDESFKYVREAVRGHPELYFARLVILGEGPSEEIVLRRLFEVSGTPLDTHFITIAPLGGRHVSHFWRLLNGLGIPFVTLLDLDREKTGGGWGRIQYVRNELVKRLGNAHERLRFQDKDGIERSLADTAYDTLSENSDLAGDELDSWLSFLARKHQVFFSAPLDLDLAMMEAFPKAYTGIASPPMGPRLPPRSDAAAFAAAANRRMQQVLSPDPDSDDNVGASYTETQRDLFPWYKYLFVDGSKPVAHMRALLAINDDDLKNKSPTVLRHLVKRARKILS